MNAKDNRPRRESPASKYKTNERIRFPKIRVVEGLPPGIYDTSDAIKQAQELGLDLVLVTENANPPVCKVIELGKLMYQEKRKDKKQKEGQSKSITKEVQFSPNIGEHDYETKKKSVIKFLEKGNKVKATVFFKGREIMFKQQGELVLAKLATEIEEYGVPESMPSLMGKNLMFIIKPRKAK
ncbi:MAG: translation initiation factor IF-3 [Nanoarchaeota archaeon]